MPRPLRIHVDHAFYHVTLRGNHRQNVFRVDSDRHLLNAIVGRALERYDSRIHAYCWMTNHLHFLVQVGMKPLGCTMRQIAAGYARAFQLKVDTTGHLFERRYHARMVCGDAYLLAVLRYIHLNPVQAGLVSAPGLYPWSSHHAYAGSRAEPWLTTDFALALFSTTRAAAQTAYRKFVAEGDPDWTPSDDDQPSADHLHIVTTTRPNSWRPPANPTDTLASLAAEACTRFHIRQADLFSVRRDRPLVLARGWLAHAAVDRAVASLSEVSRFLGRDRTTLRHAMQALRDDRRQVTLLAESEA